MVNILKLVDEEKITGNKTKENQIKKILRISIVVLIILATIIIVLIVYRSNNPDKITTKINGKVVNNFDGLLDFRTDEQGKIEVYFPIKDVAPYIGYSAFNGEYNKASEDKTTCYIINPEYEVTIFKNKSKTIYKIDLQQEEKNQTYDYITIDKAVFENNNEKLYISQQGFEQAFNVIFNYNERKKEISINTIPALANYYSSYLTNKNIGNYGNLSLDTRFSNWKALLDGMLVVKTGEKDSKEAKYGVISTDCKTIILEPKYDDIQFIQYSTDFLIKTNEKIGLISKSGKTKISASYDELTLMDRNFKLYRMKKGTHYGVIDDNENIKIHPEYDEIGLDISEFLDNGIKNNYIILDKLIPVCQNKKWGFFDLTGKAITNLKYDTIGCKTTNTNNAYSLLAIPSYDVIVVGQNNKYTFMDVSGNDKILTQNIIFDQIYMQYSSGNSLYIMRYENRTFDAIEQFKRIGLKSKEE